MHVKYDAELLLYFNLIVRLKYYYYWLFKICGQDYIKNVSN